MKPELQSGVRTSAVSYRDRAVPVGVTPVAKYATWDEHRAAMRRDAAVAGDRREERAENSDQRKTAT